MKIFSAVLVLLFVGITSKAQEQKPKAEAGDQSITQSEIVPLPSLERVLASNPLPVPELSLPRAMKFAEKYLRKPGAKLSRLHLISAEFTFVGDEKNPAPSWHLRWRKKGSTSFLGYDAELYVFMNGRVWNPPSM